MKVRESSLYCSYNATYIRNKQLHIQISEIVAKQLLAGNATFVTNVKISSRATV